MPGPGLDDRVDVEHAHLPAGRMMSSELVSTDRLTQNPLPSGKSWVSSAR